MFILKTDRATTDTSLPILKRDTLLENDNGGVLWLADMASRYSYPTLAAPVNGTAVNNMDESVNDGSILIQSGDAISYAGGGLDFSAVTKAGNHLVGPASAAASIWGSTNQYFLVCAYLKLPTQANWNAESTIFDMLTFCNSSQTYQSGAELVIFAQSSSQAISIRRQTGAATADALTLVPAAADYGSVAQIAFWRNASGQRARLKTANGTVLSSAAVNANNTQDFSALTPKLGVPPGFKGVAGEILLASEVNAKTGLRVYRTFIENLEISGRDPATVLDADYARTVGRGVFS